MFITEPWMLCTDDMCRIAVYIWGRVQILCSNKTCEKNTFLFSLGILGIKCNTVCPDVLWAEFLHCQISGIA